MPKRKGATPTTKASQPPRSTRTTDSARIRQKKKETRLGYLKRGRQVVKEERANEAAGPAAPPAQEEKETNFAFAAVKSSWAVEPQNMLDPEYYPRADNKPLPNNRVAVRHRDGRKWPKEVLGMLAGLSKETGEGKGMWRELMIHIKKAIVMRQKKHGIEARVDVGITVDDVMVGSLMWKAKVAEQDREDKERIEEMLAEQKREQEEFDEAKREEAKLMQA